MSGSLHKLGPVPSFPGPSFPVDRSLGARESAGTPASATLHIIEAFGHQLRYVAVLPHLYRLQLVRSAYGYEEYLSGGREGYVTGNASDLRRLLEFGFWRTRMCRWLQEHADGVSRELAALAR